MHTLPYSGSHLPDVSGRPFVEPARKIVVIVISLLASIFGITFGTAQILGGAPSLATADIAMSVILLANLVFLLVFNTVRFNAGVMVAACAPFFFYLLVTGGVANSGFVWSFVFPVTVFFLLGSRIGFYVSGLYLFCATCFFFLPPLMPYAEHYGFSLKVRFLGVYTLCWIVGFFYDYVRNRAIAILQTENMRRKIVERRLLEAKDRADMLYHILPAAVFTVDTNRMITSINRRAEELTGYTAGEVLLKPCPFWSSKECGDAYELMEKEVPVRNRTCMLRRKEGTTRNVLRNADCLRNERGEITGAIECLLDIGDTPPA